MDRQRWNSGFTLIEMCFVLLIVSLLSSVSLRMRIPGSVKRTVFAAGYLEAQSEAMRTYRRLDVTDGETGETLHFNAQGNTDSPRTLYFGDHRLIIELGGGRLVFR